jgi:hypothetical protein
MRLDVEYIVGQESKLEVLDERKHYTMEPQRKADTKDLEKRIAELQKNLAFVNGPSGSDSSDLFTIIHRGGWTTIIQLEIAAGLLETMNQQATAMRGLRDTLRKHVEASST